MDNGYGTPQGGGVKEFKLLFLTLIWLIVSLKNWGLSYCLPCKLISRMIQYVNPTIGNLIHKLSLGSRYFLKLLNRFDTQTFKVK